MIVPQMLKLTLSGLAVTQLVHQRHFYYRAEYCIQQFVLAASVEVHSFMVHNGRKIKQYHSQRDSTKLDNDSAYHMLYCIYGAPFTTFNILH